MDLIEELLAKKYNPSLVGFLQAAAVTIYCGLIATLFFFMTKSMNQPGFFGFFMMLALFVFSAGVTGSLVFGYPVYLALVKSRIKEALTILVYTFLYGLIVIIFSIVAVLTFF